MIRYLPLLLPIAALCVAMRPAAAQDGPSFDCARAESEVENLICETPELAALDSLVARRYAAARAAAQGLDTGAQDADAALRTFQRGWIKGRDECWKAEEVASCVRFSYLRRDAELVATWLLEEPQGTVFWACTDGPRVVTTFFDTALPSLRFEVGDSIDTGTQTPTASGARYDGSFGRFLWIKGHEATYRAPDPDGGTYACTIAETR